MKAHVTLDFSEMIHAERSKCLRALPMFTGTVLSAGCAGSWYFDWFSQCTQHSGRHIGLELYSPRPADLPPHVDWIANSVEHMEAVASSTVGLVFSGQNVEHLMPSSLAGFLVESNRVLKEDGLLVVDSPNRSVTQHLGYTQPEHTLEFTVDEIAELLELGGFELVDMWGIWLMIDPVTHRRMPLNSSREGGPTPDERRQGARSRPEQSFLWWANARKRHAPNVDGIRRFIQDLFWSQYDSFVSARFSSQVGRKQWHWGSTTIALSPSDDGYALFGPYIPLAAGRYVATFAARADDVALLHDGEVFFDVVSGSGVSTHGSLRLTNADFAGPDWRHYAIPFVLPEYATAVETRCRVRGFDGELVGRVSVLAVP